MMSLARQNYASVVVVEAVVDTGMSLQYLSRLWVVRLVLNVLKLGCLSVYCPNSGID